MEAHKIDLPPLLPVLPVRNTVLFPNAAVPLIVGRTRSVQAIKEAQKHGDLLLVVTQRDGSKEEPLPADLYRIGVVCIISKVTESENDSYQMIANGLFRFEVQEFVDKETYLTAKGLQFADLSKTGSRIETLASEVKTLGKSILTLAAVPGSDSLIKLFNQIQDPDQIADLCCTFVNIAISAKQELLETRSLEKRLELLLEHMLKEKERLVLQSEIQSKMMERLSKDQRDHLLREQLRTIHEELGDEANVNDDFGKRIEEAGLPAEAKKVAKDELNRLNLVQRSSPEYHVIRTYLEWLLNLPWQKLSSFDPSQIKLENARHILDEDHFGIEKVKKRILQFLAVTKLKQDMKGPILCLLGPPGVGKTSLGKSVAKALGRTFIRTSLGGVRDEAEIRGHRRTYIGAMPGRIMQSIKRAGIKDPVMLLDEIDKIGTDFRGDPASALLEVLDPEQNHAFVDHYLDVPFDLSRVFFITTANMVETIPSALRDRMEIIEMTSYSKAEKLEIAVKHLMPRLIEDHGIKPEQITLPPETIELVIDGYTREAGVRNLTRELAHLCRATAEMLAKENPEPHAAIIPDRVEEILGPRKFFTEVVENLHPPGVVTGLAWTPVGGEILKIEVTKMEGKGNLILTGHLGDVMKESAQIALSLLRSSGTRGSILRFDKIDFHIHVPSGAIPKDGPSAGVAIFLALASLTENRPVSSRIAITGEVTLRGTVLPVGGIKEKVIAAHRAGIEVVVLPERNRGDLFDVSQDVRNSLQFHYVKDVKAVQKIVGLSSETQVITNPLPSASEHLATN